MKRQRPFVRKLIYGAIIVALVTVLAWLAPPATGESAGSPASAGGVLAQKRAEYDLTEATLGEIDPTSETIKLATLGLRGVAVNLLWTKANEAQKTRDWTALSATVSQIIKLQPHFVAVWRFQGWNLAYNVSADWDDYRDRYAWVIKGINFLDQGIAYNQKEPILIWDKGWFIAQKIGRADERVQYRRLFREDDDFHGDRPVSQRDNWLVGKEAFRESEALVDSGVPLGGIRQLLDPDSITTTKSPVLFRADAPRCQINYAVALEEDGTFGELARVAWAQGERDWRDFGTKDIPSYETSIDTYRLGDFERIVEDLKKLDGQLDELAPGVRERIKQAKFDALSDAEKELTRMPAAERKLEERLRLGAVEVKLDIYPQEILAEISDPAQRTKAEAIAAEAQMFGRLLREINTSRDQVNYIYWTLRTQAEQSPDALAARQALYQAARAYREADLLTARTEYERGFAAWRAVTEAFPFLQKDGLTAEEVLDEVKRYRECLKQLDQEWPEDFALAELMKEFEDYFNYGK